MVYVCLYGFFPTFVGNDCDCYEDCIELDFFLNGHQYVNVVKNVIEIVVKNALNVVKDVMNVAVVVMNVAQNIIRIIYQFQEIIIIIYILKKIII